MCNELKKDFLRLGLAIFIPTILYYLTDSFLITILVGVLLITSMELNLNTKEQKDRIKEYNERLRWQKERAQMSFEERLYGTDKNKPIKSV